MVPPKLHSIPPLAEVAVIVRVLPFTGLPILSSRAEITAAGGLPVADIVVIRFAPPILIPTPSDVFISAAVAHWGQ